MSIIQFKIYESQIKMAYYIFKSYNNGQWYWHLKAANGKIIASSGEGYYNKQDCLAGIQLVKSSNNAPVYES